MHKGILLFGSTCKEHFVVGTHTLNQVFGNAVKLIEKFQELRAAVFEVPMVGQIVHGVFSG